MEALGSPTRGPHLVAALGTPHRQPRPYTAEKALALVIDMNLSKCQYQLMRKSAKSQGADKLYPPYHRVAKAKVACLPHADDVMVTASRAEVRLQALLDLTARRLLTLQQVILETLSETEAAELVLLSKWGMDGSSNHSRYKQGGLVEDYHMFVTSLVPLRLVTTAGTVVWNNDLPNSPRYCRPLALAFQKETPELIREECLRVEGEAVQLNPLREGRYQVSYQSQLTMLDEKAVGAISETGSTQTCTICEATPRQINPG